MDERGFIALAVRRPVSVGCGALLVCLLGGLALSQLPLQLTPDIAIPTLTVNTRWPGASPVEVESEVLEEQEEALKTLRGLERMEGDAEVDQARLRLELQVGTPIQEALVRATNLLSQVPSYPEAADRPVLESADDSGPPLAVLTLTGQDGRDPGAYRTWVAETVQPRLERIVGVSGSVLFGGQDREVRIEFEPEALAARGFTVRQVAEAVQAELRDVSAGDVTMGKRQLLVRTPLAPDRPEALGEVVLSHPPGAGPIRLRDVAEVEYGLRKPRARVLSDDRPSMVFLLFREAGSNVLEVTRAIRTEVDRLQVELLDARALQLSVVSDQVEYIEGALRLVGQNLVVGGLLAVVVLFVFLGSLRASAVISVAIPVSTLGTALGMAVLGRTINVVSLAGMAFAVGMVVDNAIVVLENIDTQRRKTDVVTAAVTGTREVWGAVLASTLTTIVVFLPIISWRDEVGEILRDVAVAISLAVGCSLVVSVVIIPSFAAAFLRGSESATSDRPAGGLRSLGHRARARVGQAVARLVARPGWSAGLVGSALGACATAVWLLLPPMEYLPTGNRGFIFGLLVPPPGLSVDEMGKVGEALQRRMVPHVGQAKDGVPPLERWVFAGRPNRIFTGVGVGLGEDVDAVVRWYRGVLQEVPGMFAIANRASLFGRSLSGARSIDLEIQGADLPTLVGVASTLLQDVRARIPDAQVRPQPSLEPGAPELHVLPYRDQAARLGLSPSELGQAVDALVDGTIIGELGPAGDPEVDVVLSARRSAIDSPTDLAAAPIATPGGALVPLGAVARIEESLGPTKIRRVERQRTITLDVSPPESVPLEQAIATIRALLDERTSDGSIPLGVTTRLEGSAGDLERAQSRFLWVLLAAVVVSYLLMSGLFEDLLAPLAVLVTVPFAAAGGVLCLRLVDATLGSQAFDLVTAVGFIILIGVVVNNAILVVDGALVRIRAGVPLEEAIGASVEGRLRPIFMSALTSLAGLSPLVLFPGSGSELYRGVGSVVLGGLALSTVLTVFIVPPFYGLLERLRGRA
jgi:HAE1 family hydrophobic/amphiphilic exporter-1